MSKNVAEASLLVDIDDLVALVSLDDDLVALLGQVQLVRPDLVDLAPLLGLPPFLQLLARQLLRRHGHQCPRPDPARHHFPEEAQVLLVLQVEHEAAVLVLVLWSDILRKK